MGANVRRPPPAVTTSKSNAYDRRDEVSVGGERRHAWAEIPRREAVPRQEGERGTALAERVDVQRTTVVGVGLLPVEARQPADRDRRADAGRGGSHERWSEGRQGSS